jgi:hypothetical protein
MVAAWRVEVSGVWPGLADDDVLSAHLLDHQLLLVWVNTWSALAGRCEKPAALVTWWHNLDGYAERQGEDEVSAHAREVAAALDRHFGPGLELPLYPAFR